MGLDVQPVASGRHGCTQSRRRRDAAAQVAAERPVCCGSTSAGATRVGARAGRTSRSSARSTCPAATELEVVDLRDPAPRRERTDRRAPTLIKRCRCRCAVSSATCPNVDRILRGSPASGPGVVKRTAPGGGRAEARKRAPTGARSELTALCDGPYDAPLPPQAIARTRAMCEEYLKGRYELRVIRHLQAPPAHAPWGADHRGAHAPVKRLPLPLRRWSADLSDPGTACSVRPRPATKARGRKGATPAPIGHSMIGARCPGRRAATSQKRRGQKERLRGRSVAGGTSRRSTPDPQRPGGRALVLRSPDGDTVYALETADRPYRVAGSRSR